MSLYDDLLAARKSRDPRALVSAYDALIAAGPKYVNSTVANLGLNWDNIGAARNAQMEILSEQTPDQFDVLAKEAALQALRTQRKTTRASSFVTGPRGLEGPLANLIGGGGASTLGR